MHDYLCASLLKYPLHIGNLNRRRRIFCLQYKKRVLSVYTLPAVHYGRIFQSYYSETIVFDNLLNQKLIN